LEDEEAMDWCKRILKAFIGQGEQVQGMSWKLAKGERSSGVWKKRKKRRRCVKNFFSSYVCKNQAWKECV